MNPPQTSSNAYDKLVADYEAQGFHHVHIRHDNPGMVYAPHYHPDHVVLEVLEGELDTEVDGRHIHLTSGQKIDIVAERFHTTVVGQHGCVYLHAEKRVTS